MPLSAKLPRRSFCAAFNVRTLRLRARTFQTGTFTDGSVRPISGRWCSAAAYNRSQEGSVKRRRFIAASIAASTLAAAGKSVAMPPSFRPKLAGDPAGPRREFYLLRRYNLMSGQQLKLTENYFAGALIPALARMGSGAGRRVQARHRSGDAGLLPAHSRAVCRDTGRAGPAAGEDAEFLEAADPFWNATRRRPPFSALKFRCLGRFHGLAEADAAGFRRHQGQAHVSAANLREPQQRRARAQGGDVPLRRVRDLFKAPASIRSSSATRWSARACRA